MKRLIPVIFFVLLFSSCKTKSYYLHLQSDSNNYQGEYHIVFYNKNNKVLSQSEKQAYNTTIKVSWDLIPDSPAIPSINNLTVITDTDNYLNLITKDNHYLEYAPKDIGDTKITIKSSDYGSAVLKIRVVLID